MMQLTESDSDFDFSTNATNSTIFRGCRRVMYMYMHVYTCVRACIRTRLGGGMLGETTCSMSAGLVTTCYTHTHGQSESDSATQAHHSLC